MKEQLKKAIELSKKTGDRLMVYDISESHDPYIVMAIDDYEKMVVGASADNKSSLTDVDLTDKINRDIAVWKDGQTRENSEIIKAESGQNNEPVYEKYEEKEDPIVKIEEVGDEEDDDEFQKGGNKGNWNIPDSRKN